MVLTIGVNSGIQGGEGEFRAAGRGKGKSIQQKEDDWRGEPPTPLQQGHYLLRLVTLRPRGRVTFRVAVRVAVLLFRTSWLAFAERTPLCDLGLDCFIMINLLLFVTYPKDSQSKIPLYPKCATKYINIKH